MPRNWDFAVRLAGGDRDPLFRQISRAIASDVRRGRLRPGDRLPGTRTLAATLGVHRNTVIAAYAELVAEGWAAAAPAGGTFVSRDLPERATRPAPGSGIPERPAFNLAPLPATLEPVAPPHVLAISRGIPDGRLLPVAELARAYRRALRTHGRSVLGYGDASGHPKLRRALASMLGSLRGLAAAPGNVIVTRGSQQGIDLLARTLVRPGDAVAIESYGYRPAWTALERAGAALHPVPVDRSGLDVSALGALARKRRLRAVYLTPHHQYPTTVTLSAARRLAAGARTRAPLRGHRGRLRLRVPLRGSSRPAARERRCGGVRRLRRDALQDPRAGAATRVRRGSRGAQDRARARADVRRSAGRPSDGVRRRRADRRRRPAATPAG
ncbi:MAG: PLP-dependent aminotransferase family protein [Acidobacteriota bacterium]